MSKVGDGCNARCDKSECAGRTVHSKFHIFAAADRILSSEKIPLNLNFLLEDESDCRYCEMFGLTDVEYSVL